MFGFFSLKKRVEEIDKSTAASFSKVKQDVESLSQWIQYLHAQNNHLGEQNSVLKRLVDEQRFALSEIKVTVSHLPKAPEIHQLIDSRVNFEPMLQRVKHIEQKLVDVEKRPVHVPAPVHQPAPQIQHVVHVPQPQKPQSALKEKLIRNLARNSKEYIKRLVLGMVHKNAQIGALQLRESIVEEQGLCSKSSFYRILEEMEKEGSLHVVSQGKHTVYVSSKNHA